MAKNTPALPDPRIEELREMGLPRVWLKVAEAIGVDALLNLWRKLDTSAEASASTPHSAP